MSKRLFLFRTEGDMPRIKVARLGDFDICKALGNSDYDFSPILVTVMEQAIHEILVHLVQRPMDRSITSFPQVSKKWEGLFKSAVCVLYDYLDEQLAGARAAFPSFGLAAVWNYHIYRYPWWNKQVRQLAAVAVWNNSRNNSRTEYIPRGLFFRWVANRCGDPWSVKICCPLVSIFEMLDCAFCADPLDRAFCADPLPDIFTCEGQRVDEAYALLLLYVLFTSIRYKMEYFGALTWAVAAQAKLQKRATLSWSEYEHPMHSTWSGEIPPPPPYYDD